MMRKGWLTFPRSAPVLLARQSGSVARCVGDGVHHAVGYRCRAAFLLLLAGGRTALGCDRRCPRDVC